MTAIIVILFCIAIGPYGWFWLIVGVCLFAFSKTDSTNTTPIDRDCWRPLSKPSRADSDLGNLDFSSSEWERTGDDSVTNIYTHVTFTRSIGGYWTADDDDGSGNNSEYYGWYRIED